VFVNKEKKKLGGLIVLQHTVKENAKTKQNHCQIKTNNIQDRTKNTKQLSNNQKH